MKKPETSEATVSPTATEMTKIKAAANAEAKRVETKLPIPAAEAKAMAVAIRKAGEQGIVLSLYFMDVTADSKLLAGLAIETGIRRSKADNSETRELVAKLVSATGKWSVKSKTKSDFVTARIPYLAGRKAASRDFMKLLGLVDSDLNYSVELYYIGAVEKHANADFQKLTAGSSHIPKVYQLIKKGSPGAMQKINARKNGASERIRKILAPELPGSPSNLNNLAGLLNQGVGAAANGTEVLEWAEQYAKNYVKEIEKARTKIIGMKIDWAQKVRLAERIAENLSSSRSSSSFQMKGTFNDHMEGIFNGFIVSMKAKGNVSNSVGDLIHEDLKTQSDEVKARKTNKRGKISKRQGVNMADLEIGRAQEHAVENILKMDGYTKDLFKLGGTIARRLGYVAIVMDVIFIVRADSLEEKVSAAISATGAAIVGTAVAKAGALAGGALGAAIAGPVGAAVGALVLGAIGGIAGGLLGAYVGEEIANEWADDVANYLEEAFSRGRRWVEEESVFVDTPSGRRDLKYIDEREFLDDLLFGD